VINIYKLFVKETNVLIAFYDLGKRFLTTSLPNVEKADTGIIDSLEAYIEKLNQPEKHSSEEENHDKNSKKNTNKPKRKSIKYDDPADEDLKDEDNEEYEDQEHKDKKDDDSEGSQNESSSQEEEPEDLMKYFTGISAQQQAFYTIAPNLVPPVVNNQPTYNDKQAPASVNQFKPNPSIPSAPNQLGLHLALNPFQVNNTQYPNTTNPFNVNPFLPVGNNPNTGNNGIPGFVATGTNPFTFTPAYVGYTTSIPVQANGGTAGFTPPHPPAFLPPGGTVGGNHQQPLVANYTNPFL